MKIDVLIIINSVFGKFLFYRYEESSKDGKSPKSDT